MTLALALAFPATAQQPVLMQAKDANGAIRTLRTDTSGQVVLSPTQSTVATTAYSSSPTISANGTTCSAAGGASCTVIFSEVNLAAWPNVTITIRNTGANALSNCLIEWSPPNSTNTGSAALYEVWDAATFANLASGAELSLSFAGNSRAYLRIEGRSASGTTLYISVTANSG